MKSFSSLLIDHIESLSKEEIVHMSELFQISVDNTIKLADNLIAWARIQMNDFETIPQTVNVKEVISNVYELYKDVANKKEIDVSYSIEDSLAVFADSNQVEFIIRNLVNNAIKYTNRGGSVKIKGVTAPNNEVEISISDNGIGISDRMKEKIFSIDKNHSRNGTDGETGTGLGLMLCYEFTKLNGGKIDIESEENKGTTFTLNLKQSV
jgi:signal transduction histidine kinase